MRPNGRGIIFMPSDYFRQDIVDADLGAMIAYLKSLPPVDNERTAVEINPAARLMILVWAVRRRRPVRALHRFRARRVRRRLPDPRAYLGAWKDAPSATDLGI